MRASCMDSGVCRLPWLHMVTSSSRVPIDDHTSFPFLCSIVSSFDTWGPRFCGVLDDVLLSGPCPPLVSLLFAAPEDALFLPHCSRCSPFPLFSLRVCPSGSFSLVSRERRFDTAAVCGNAAGPALQVCGPPPMMAAISGDKNPDKSQGEVSGLLAKMGYTSDSVFKF